MNQKDQITYSKPTQPQEKAFRTFEDLEVYQVAREFRKAMYAFHLRERKQGESLPLHENSPAYGLTEADLDDLFGEAAHPTLQPFNAYTV